MAPLSRRTVLRLIGYGSLLASCGRAGMLPDGVSGAERQPSISPIDRTLGDTAPMVFFGDDPESAHARIRDSVPVVDRTARLGRRLVVVGGGISGLTAAYELRDFEPLVLEQASRFGGNSKGQSWRGIDYALGAAYIGTPDPGSGIARLLADLGLSGVSHGGSDPVMLRGTIAELDRVGGAQYTKLVRYLSSVFDGKAAVPYPEIPLPSGPVPASFAALDRITLREHLETALGGSFEPIVLRELEQYSWSSFGASLGEISAAAGLNFLAAEAGSQLVFPGGNAAIAERLVERLSGTSTLAAGCAAVKIWVDAGRAFVAYREPDGRLTTVRADAVIVTTPKFIVPRILEGIEPERVAAIRRLRYRSYLVANVLLSRASKKRFYDLYLLGDGSAPARPIAEEWAAAGATDTVLATFARPDPARTVLTLYRAIPFDGARSLLLVPDAYERFRGEFRRQIDSQILPALGFVPSDVVDLRLARWGHPLPVAAPGLVGDGTIEAIRRPFQGRVYFSGQDSWATPSFESGAGESLIQARAVRTVLGDV